MKFLFRGTLLMRMLALCILLFFAAISLDAQSWQDLSRTVVKTDSKVEFHATAGGPTLAGSATGSR